VQRLLDAGAVIGAERRNARADVRDILVADRYVRQIPKVVFETGLRRTAQVEHDFNDVFEVTQTDESLPNREREDVEELGEFPTRGDGMNSYCQKSFLTSEAFVHRYPPSGVTPSRRG
jgi:hypothetical protein